MSFKKAKCPKISRSEHIWIRSFFSASYILWSLIYFDFASSGFSTFPF